VLLVRVGVERDLDATFDNLFGIREKAGDVNGTNVFIPNNETSH
jgi:hypothetical protein